MASEKVTKKVKRAKSNGDEIKTTKRPEDASDGPAIIRRVAYNLKPQKVEVRQHTLGRLNLVYGDNGTGKTTLNHAVELPLTGAADDFQGRDSVRDEAMLIGLAPGRGEHGEWAISQIETSDGRKGSWRCHREGTVVKNAPPNPPAGEDSGDSKRPSPTFPLRRVRAGLGGDAKTGRKFFFEQACGGLSDDDVLACLPSTLRTSYKNIGEALVNAKAGTEDEEDLFGDGVEASANTSAVARLSAVAQYAGKQKLAEGRAVKTAESLVERLKQNLAPRPNDADIDAVKTVQTAAQDRLAKANAWEGYESALRRAQVDRSRHQPDAASMMSAIEEKRRGCEATILQAEQAIQGWGVQLQAAEADLVLLVPAHGGSLAKRTDLAIEILSTSVQEGICQCPICSSPIGSEHLQTCLDYYVRQQQQVTQEREGEKQRRAAIEGRLSEARRNQAQWAATLDGARQALGHLKFPSAATVLPVAVSEEPQAPSGPPPENPGIAASAAREQVESAWLEVNRLVRVAASWDQVQKARDEVEGHERKAHACSGLSKACLAAMEELLDARIETFKAVVQKYMPDGWSFHLRLREKKRAVFQMGVVVDGVLYTALGGVEWATTTAAIAMAICEREFDLWEKSGRQGAGPLRLIIIEDRMWKTSNLAKVMGAFSTFRGQVFIHSTELPDGEWPVEWTLIDVEHPESGVLETEDEIAYVESADRSQIPSIPSAATGATWEVPE